MPRSNKVTIKFGDKSTTVTPNQVTIRMIKTFFGINANDIYLQNATNVGETEWDDGDGKFSETLQGTWNVMVQSDSANDNSEQIVPQGGNTSNGSVNLNSLYAVTASNNFAPNRPPVATGMFPSQQARLTIGRSHQAPVTVFNPSMVVPLAGNSATFGGGQRPSARRQLDFVDQPEFHTIHFYLAKRVSSGKIVESRMNGMAVVPVSFTDEQLKSVRKMNEKVTNSMKNKPEFTGIKVTDSFEIWGPTRSKLTDFEEMERDGIRYWFRQRSKVTKYFIVPVTDDNEVVNSSDSEDYDPPTKKGRAPSSEDMKKLKRTMKSVVSKCTETIGNQIKDFTATVESSKASNEEETALKGLLKSLCGLFECRYCCQITNKPVVCGNCHHMVACKCCADEELEVVDEDRVKGAGQWKCPRCHHWFFSRNPNAYKEVEIGTELTYLKKWSQDNKDL